MSLKKYFVFAVLSFGAFAGHAKDLTHRLGVGFRDSTSTSIPSVAAVYYSSKETAYTASVGMDTLKNYPKMQASVGFRSMIFFENNLNCYLSTQIGAISVEDPANGRSSGLEVMALGGVEFFMPGLENLAFTAEAGLGISTVRSTRIYTAALDPFRAGIIFYF